MVNHTQNAVLHGGRQIRTHASRPTLRITSLIAPLITLFTFLLYLATLAPTVLWGDDALFQASAYVGRMGSDGSGHWLWFQLARRFVHLPVGDIAYRVNLLSAIAAALTLGTLYGVGRALRLSPLAATVAATALALAHTFWMHAVRAEVYTLFTLWLAVELWLWARWHATSSWPIEAAVFLMGVGLLAHQMAILLLPALALLLWWQRAWLSPIRVLRLVLAGMAALLVFLLTIQSYVRGDHLLDSVMRYFTHAGRDYGDAFFDFSLATLPRDVALWLGFLGLQFAGVAGLLGAWAVIALGQHAGTLPKIWYALGFAYITTTLFAISYRVNDHYVFFLPGYLIFALLVGQGWDFAVQRWQWFARRGTQLLALLLMVTLPPLLYYTAGTTLAARHINPLGIRELPGREPNTFFLWPWKHKYAGAANYARQVWEALPTNSYLIADHTPYETLSYSQRVEGMRPDVQIIKIGAGDDLRPIIQQLPPTAQVFIADNDPRYYNLEALPGTHAVSAGVIYALVPAQE